MKAGELRKKFLNFFEKKEHAVINGAPLIPEHDPTVLFTTAGMHPLVPFLLGQPHPQGNRLTNVQKCLRTGDIEEVGDNTHLTFFEMLGNWSLGDYFKKEAIKWSYEFLIKVLEINPEKLYVTVFEGDDDAPKDEESANIWKSLGIPDERIFFLPKEDNWWGPAGETGPCGPDTEMFIDCGKPKCGDKCKPGCDCGKYVEVWNDVFMEYNKNKEGDYERLEQKNVDTGMGLERMTAMLQEKESVYEIGLLQPLMNLVKELSGINEFSENELKSSRIIIDHVRAATFILGDEIGVTPSNTGQGYVLRRLIRRVIRHARLLDINENICQKISGKVIELHKDFYPILKKKKSFIIKEFEKEENKFMNTLEKGLNHFKRIAKKSDDNIGGEDAFLLYQSYGFPIEITKELAEEKGLSVDVKGFRKAYEKHKQKSKKRAGKRFKGGLADKSEKTTKLHTATHLLLEALKRVVDENIHQKGSNITPKRLRFDFNLKRKLTKKELKKVEDLVNKKIKEGLEIRKEKMSVEKAKKIGAESEFMEKYSDKVFVYFIGDFSKEICAGPHVKNTEKLGGFKIIKHNSVGANTKRIRAVLE